MSNIKKLVNGLGEIKGVSFMSVTYRNKNNELAKQLVNIGESYASAKLKDIEKLEALNLAKINDFQGLDFEAIKLLEEARTTLIEAFKNPNKARSQGQKDAYLFFDNIKGLKLHVKTEKLYIFALGVRRTVIEKGVYDSRNDVSTWEGKKPLTRAKNFLKANFCRTNKFKNFIFDSEQLSKMKVSGETIELS